jgi:putative transposase
MWLNNRPARSTPTIAPLGSRVHEAAIFTESDHTYGYSRIHAALVRQGEHCGPELVREIMRELGLVSCQSSSR